MNKTPEEIRREIEETRSELGTDVDAVQDKVSPSSIAHRKTSRARESFSRVKHNIMGETDNARGSAGSKAHQAQDVAQEKARETGHAIQDAPHQAWEKTQGNPLAAGLVAFGAGMLASALIPASQKEQEAAQQVKERSQPLVSEAKDAAKGVAEDLKEPAKQAAEDVKGSAQDSAQTVKEEGQHETDEMKDRAKEAQSNVKGSGQSSSGTSDQSGTGGGQHRI